MKTMIDENNTKIRDGMNLLEKTEKGIFNKVDESSITESCIERLVKEYSLNNISESVFNEKINEYSNNYLNGFSKKVYGYETLFDIIHSPGYKRLGRTYTGKPKLVAKFVGYLKGINFTGILKVNMDNLESYLLLKEGQLKAAVSNSLEPLNCKSIDLIKKKYESNSMYCLYAILEASNKNNSTITLGKIPNEIMDEILEEAKVKDFIICDKQKKIYYNDCSSKEINNKEDLVNPELKKTIKRRTRFSLEWDTDKKNSKDINSESKNQSNLEEQILKELEEL